MTSVWFVTPAWQRYELTRVVLEQRRLAISFLEERGIEGRQVVVADDHNAEIAEELGMDVLRRPNYPLARRFNDGFQYAAQQGADWVVPIGSDSFLDPAYLFPLPDPGVLRSSAMYALADATRLGRVPVKQGIGVGPYMIPRSHLPKTLRPAQEWRKRGVDGSTIRGLRPGYSVEMVDLHPWQYVGFRRDRDAGPEGHPQMNSYDKLYRRLGVGQEAEVEGRLSEYFPASLVRRALMACAAVEVAA